MNSDATTSGRPIFALGAAVVVLVAAGLGLIVGASGQERDASVDLLGVVTFEMTPVAMAAFGVLVTAGVMAVLFGLVRVASRYDAQADDPK